MRNEYPRPDFVREAWYSLNGKWQWTAESGESEIEVPFACQSRLSGVTLPPSDHLCYQRSFCVPQAWRGKDILLHFGAVDYSCRVLINGQLAGSHCGGSTPFTFPITPYLSYGTETLRVEVYDPLSDEGIPRGKQFWAGDPRFIWYTQTSGIWQSVWIEPVEQTALSELLFTPDIDAGTVRIAYRLRRDAVLPCTLETTIKLKGETVFSGTVSCTERSEELTVDVFHHRAMAGSFHFTGNYWSPENPLLYEVEVTVSAAGHLCDHVASYFGMRQVTVQNGRIFLNHRPCYQKLLLDQGYWREGGLTAPSDTDYRDDILKMKAMGFNGCRKHEKLEDPRFLYWADQLGFLVWESTPSFWSYSPQACDIFMQEWRRAMRRDYNHPCIIAWEMLNESWGVPCVCNNTAQQSFSVSLYHMAKSMDTTRLVVGNDGWEQTDSDVCALHSYQHGEENDPAQQELFAQCLRQPERMAEIMEKPPYAKGYCYQGQPLMLTECGGISVAPSSASEQQATENSSNWGYTSVAAEHFLRAYRRLIEALRSAPHFCGFCYTQLADVEQEINGLLTEEHAYKFDAEAIRQLNESL